MKSILFCFFFLLLALAGCGQNRMATNPHTDESDTRSLTRTYGWTNEAAGADNTNQNRSTAK